MQWAAESFEDERKRKNAELRPMWEAECEWHLWFAWYPVNISPDRKAWLCHVERRLSYFNRSTQPNWFEWGLRWFEYRPAKMVGEP